MPTAVRDSLARRFARSAALLAAIAVLLGAGASWWWIDRLHRDALQALQQKDAELHAQQVAATLGGVATRLAEIAASPLLTTALTDSSGRESYVRPYLGSVQAINAVPVELLFVDFAGQEVARNGDLDFSPAQRAWLLQRIEQQSPGSLLSTDAEGEVLLAVELVRYSRTQTVEGALLLKLHTRQLLPDTSFRLAVTPATAPGLAPPDGARVVLPPVFRDLRFEVLRTAEAAPPARLAWHPELLALAAMALVGSVLVIGRRLAHRLTADLSELERFARSVTGQAFGSERARVTGSHEVASLAQSVNQMLDRLNAQHARLQGESEAQLRLLATCIARLNDTVLITEAEPFDAPGPRILFVNDAFERLTGYTREEVLGRTPRLLQGPDTSRVELARIRAAMERWQPVRAELLNYAKDGRAFWAEIAINPVTDASGHVTHWVSVERDVTERREAESTRRSLELHVREAQKMEAIGTLAGGVAHDFNNILGAILGNLTLARTELPPGHVALDRLEQIHRSASRARSLVHQILTFSRRQPTRLEAQALQPLLEEFVALLRATVPARVRIVTTLAAEPLHARVDANALQQVLMNLGTNAWHALQGSTGQVEFGLARGVLTPDTAGAARPTALPAGEYVHLWVRDDGCGMDAATQARIFEPFFTTKPVGEGTGLGLSVVHGIVQSHGGALSLESAPGCGTTFHLHLPLVAAPPDSGQALAVAPARGHGEHVLYIDDDEVMVAMAEALLASWGYRVTALRDAPAAVAAVQAHPADYDLVVTDFNMPVLSGLDVLREIARVRADLPAILASGYLSDEVRDEALRAGARALLHKENLQDELAALIGEVLADAARAPIGNASQPAPETEA